MSKLLSVLIAGFFAAGAIAQTTTAPAQTSGATAGALSGSASNATSASASTNTNTNANTVNVYGPGSNKLARQQQGTTAGAAPGTTGTGSTTNSAGGSAGEAGTPGNATSGAHATNTCPPGLAKRDNGCMAPGHAKTRHGTTTLGNTSGASASTSGAGADGGAKGAAGGGTGGKQGTTSTPK